jgi:hypothetical protein
VGENMKSGRFNQLLEDRLNKIKSVLASKAVEYSHDDDRLYNFKRSAQIRGKGTQQDALSTMWTKHLTSVFDMIDGKIPVTTAMIDEKIGDSINYLILLEASFIEDLEESDIRAIFEGVKG